ncbi:glycosyltransferase family 2 protein [Herbaspirillum sp.]|uniref:glycosyltransferase family 2 protein n=1 Tax=Herbaspirillum sp. TaxID=1890675 RepID=UPI001B0397E5|nr:glycosyltransferase family 2 protein [Herbaspirillum sp.]MBO9538213.1 glycosyltransferase family 2 protein [Herbaspirillum sp.]
MNLAAYKAAAVIPVYNHEHAIAAVVQAVLGHKLHCVLVDDGCSAACAKVLRDIAQAHPERITLLVHAHNQGKGGAVMTGLRHVAQAGYTHALQIDADGQHEAADIPRFISASQAAPLAVINGKPIYDQSVPKGRLYARYLTHVWVWINTLSLEISDSMCGFRLYPLAPTINLMNSAHIGRRMDFDTEILVRLYWRGLRVRNLPTRVRYPADGVSHFKVWLDNALISRMHARLFFGMLLRSPLLLSRRLCRTLAGNT